MGVRRTRKKGREEIDMEEIRGRMVLRGLRQTTVTEEGERDTVIN